MGSLLTFMFALFTVLRTAGETLAVAVALKMLPDSVLSRVSSLPAERAEPVRLSAKEFGSKFSTKRECFTFLTIDCHAYLPSYDTVTIYFVSRRMIM